MADDKIPKEQPSEEEYNGPEQEPEIQEPEFRDQEEKARHEVQNREDYQEFMKILGNLQENIGPHFPELDFDGHDEERSWLQSNEEGKKSILEHFKKIWKQVDELSLKEAELEEKYGEQFRELDETTIGTIKREAQYQRLIEYSLQNNFKELFNQYCYENDLLGEMMYHTLIGMCFKEKKMPDKHGNLINFNTHIIAIADSGTGKDQACDFLTNFIRELNYTITQYNTQNPEHQIGTFRVFELGGTESVEVFLDHFPKKGGIYETTKTKKDKDGKKKEENIEPINGILSANDLIIARECSYLFKEKGGQKQQKIEVLLVALEGKPQERTLLSWNGRSTTTHAQCAFIGTTRPIEDMKAHIVYSGFQQRALNYCVKVQTETREKIVQKLAEEIKRTPAQKQKLIDDRKKIAEEFLQMRLWIKNNDIMIEPTDQETISTLVSNRIISLIKQVETEIGSPEYREIFESFIARLHHHIQILAFHNAASRKSFFVEVSDYENALALVEKTFGLLQDWVAGSISESKESQARWKKFEQTYREVLTQNDKDHKGLERGKLNELVAKKLGYSFSFAKTITTNLSRGNYALLEIKKRGDKIPDLVRLRKQEA